MLARSSINPSSALKQFGLFFAMFAAAVILATIAAMISANPGRRVLDSMLYDRAAETTASGVVTEVQEFLCPCSGSNPGTHLLLQTAEGSMQVHVADAQYLRTRGVSFMKGDQIQAVGARVRHKGREVLLAREVMRGGQKIIFRDAQGQPLWAP
jgi:hypothetical protein